MTRLIGSKQTQKTQIFFSKIKYQQEGLIFKKNNKELCLTTLFNLLTCNSLRAPFKDFFHNTDCFFSDSDSSDYSYDSNEPNNKHDQKKTTESLEVTVFKYTFNKKNN